MLLLEDALESDPECDILSVIPSDYNTEKIQESAPPSSIALLNRSTIETLQWLAGESPEIGLLSHFPKHYQMDYDRRIEVSDHKALKISKPPTKPDLPPDDTLTRLASATTANVEFPLSDTVHDLISGHDDDREISLTSSETLALSLKRLFTASEKLWEFPIRGAVFKCSDEVVAKVICGLNNSTEYTSMQYLYENAPDIPAPRPNGLVKIGNHWAIFMTYIPSITLEDAWPSLCHEQKASVQHQLNDILTKMREIKAAR